MTNLNNDTFVSIIVALYNQKNTFDYVFKALINQNTNIPYEIIFADDGSNIENTIYYLNKIKEAALISNIEIKFIQQQDRGFRLATSRNNALQIARGNIIISIDGDVIIDKNLIENHLKMYGHNELTLVYTNRQHKDINEIGSDLPSKNTENIERTRREKTLKDSFDLWHRVWGFNTSFSRPLNKKQDILYDDNFIGWGHEDTEFSYRLYHQHGYKIVNNNDVVSYHIMPEKFTDNPYKTLEPKDLLSFINNALYFIEKYNYDKKIIDSILPKIPIYDFERNQVTRKKISEISSTTEEMLKNVIEIKNFLEKKNI